MVLKLSFDSNTSSGEIFDIDDEDFLYASVGNMKDLKSVIKTAEKTCDEIVLDVGFDTNEFRDLLEYVKGKVIIYAPYYSIDNILKYIKDNNLYDYRFISDGNVYKPVTYEKLVKENNYINSIANYVNKFKLSPYEKTLFAADLIRELRYRHSNNEKPGDIESQSLSRDLYSLLEDDSIVCEGYANIYSAVLTKLGIENTILFYMPSKDADAPGHAANLIILKDGKYNIDGIYTYDLTWVSSNHKDYLRNYNYLGLPIEYDSLAKKEKYALTNEKNLIKSDIQKLKDRIDTLQRFIELDAPDIRIKVSENMVEEAFKLCYGKYLKGKEKNKYKEYYNKYDEPLKGIKEYYSLIKDKCISEIPDSIFYEALYNVRRVENSIDKDKYIFDKGELAVIADKRHAFMSALRTKSGLKHALDIQKTEMQRLLDVIFNTCDDDEIEEVLCRLRKGVKLYIDADTQLCKSVEDSAGKSMYDELDLDGERMGLISVLRKVAKQDTSNPALNRKMHK